MMTRFTSLKFKFYFILYFVVVVLFTIYTFSQIDLNLTLSSFYIYQIFQKKLIYLGYFNRPMSTLFFMVLLSLLFLFYFIFLHQARKGRLSLKTAVFLVSLSTAILLFSYPAFSHDLFNYIFDARIVTKYGLNPYFYKAGDFPNDLWTRFMHWTHRTYPYGPLWLLITLPSSYLGMGKFVLTLLLFKFMFASFHIFNVYLIWKIGNRIYPGRSRRCLRSALFYGLNPLILIESLVSPHNEVVMLFFLLFSFYLLIEKKHFFSLLSLLASAMVKFTTIVLAPLYAIFLGKGKDIESRYVLFLKWAFFVFLIPLLAQIYYREAFSWYFIPSIGVGALIFSRKIEIFLVGISIGSLLRYAPYLYHGDYTQLVQSVKDWLFVFFTALSILWVIILHLKGSYITHKVNIKSKKSK